MTGAQSNVYLGEVVGYLPKDDDHSFYYLEDMRKWYDWHKNHPTYTLDSAEAAFAEGKGRITRKPVWPPKFSQILLEGLADQ
jgi:hypothetical protein